MKVGAGRPQREEIISRGVHSVHFERAPPPITYARCCRRVEAYDACMSGKHAHDDDDVRHPPLSHIRRSDDDDSFNSGLTVIIGRSIDRPTNRPHAKPPATLFGARAATTTKAERAGETGVESRGKKRRPSSPVVVSATRVCDENLHSQLRRRTHQRRAGGRRWEA